MHSNIPFSKSIQISFTRQGFGVHGVRSISHVGPVKSAAHSHEKSLISSVQVPLFKHGFGMQSSMSSKQPLPVKPSIHTQVYVEFPSIHSLEPSKLQGSNCGAPENPEELDSRPEPDSTSTEQKSMSLSQNCPVQPMKHSQTKFCSGRSMQVPFPQLNN